MKYRSMLPEVRRSTAWSPMREISRLQRKIDRMFDEVMEPSTFGMEFLQPSFEELEFAPPCDIEETDTHYLLSFDLPGVSKNDVKVALRDHDLVVSGERKEEKEHKEGTQRTQERHYGAFQRVLTLPQAAQLEKVEANYENGILQVAVPKLEVSKAKVIPIKEERGGIFTRLLPQRKTDKAA